MAMENKIYRLGAIILVMGWLSACDQSGSDTSTADNEAVPAPEEMMAPEDSQAEDNPSEVDPAPTSEEILSSSEILANIMAADHRSDEARARDASRHPAETLAFFGLESGMTVIEIWPFGGWYTRIIAPYLQQGGGTYYAAKFVRDGAPSGVEKFLETFGDSALYGDVRIAVHGADVPEIAPENTADMVVSFRNLHNWLPRGWDQKAFDDIYRVLKPGGIFGLVDHRAKTDAPQDPKAASGYVREDYTIALAEKSGFVLVGSSLVNNNPNDSADHPFGVWTLPPTLMSQPRGEPKDEAFDHAPYIAIGESDRYTLKFMKPRAE